MAGSASPTKFRVAWAGVAEEDAAAIADYLARDSVDRALALLDELERRAQSLERFPLRGRVVPELASFGVQAFRELIAPPLRLIYETNAAARLVHVVAVVDGRRDVREILMRRFRVA